MRISLNKKYIINIYYILLLALYISWNNMNSVPGAIYRIVYFAATLIPVFLWRMKLLPFVILFFFSLATNGYTSSYLPVEEYTYITPLIVGLFFIKDKEKVPFILFLMLIIPFLINSITNFDVELISSTVLIIILSMLCVKKNDKFQLSINTLIIISISFLLTLTYYLYGNNFSTEYTGFEDERIGFADINYVACIIGFGTLLAIIEFFKNKKIQLPYMVFLIVVILSSVIALLLNASRGSMLALGVGIAILILLSKRSMKVKIISILVLLIMGLYLYTNNYMDLLLYRINNDDSTGGGGRIDIWMTKFKLWSESDSIFNLIFGYGYVGGRKLGVIGQVAFHNDFLAFLVEYGIIGLIIFIYFIIYPILKSNKENKAIVLACTAYLIAVCLTLEPFAAGRIPFYLFWMYIYYHSRIEKLS